MLIFRWILVLLLLASALSFVWYVGTGQARYRQWGLVILKWAVIAGLAFFAVLIAGRWL